MSIPSLSVIVPVFNEAGTIERLLSHLSALKTPGGMEVVVADGNARATTLKAIPQHLRQAVPLKTALAPRGRGVQMNHGALSAEGAILLFLHADTLLSQAAVDRMLMVMEHRPSLAGGAFSLGIDSPRKAFRIIEAVANRRSRLTKIPYGDQGLFIRKNCFFSIGGFAEIPLMEDVELMRRIKKKRGEIIILPEKIMTSARRWRKEGIVRCTLRNWLLISLYLCGVSPFKLAGFYQF